MKNKDKTTETVLLVDDEDMVIDSCKPMLQALGYEVLVARDGVEAIYSYARKTGIESAWRSST